MQINETGLSALAKHLFAAPAKWREWLVQTLGCAEEELETESNAMLYWEKQGAGARKLILFRLRSCGAVVKAVGEDSCTLLPFSDTKAERLQDSVCFCGGEAAGLIHAAGNEDKSVICKPLSALKVGDCCLLPAEVSQSGELFYGAQLGVLVQWMQALSLIAQLKDSAEAVTVAVVDEGIAGVERTLNLVRRANAEAVLVSACAAAKEEFAVGKGVGVVIKDKNYVAAQGQYARVQKAAQEEALAVQPFVGDSSAVMERIYLTAKTRRILGIYLPAERLGSRLEEIRQGDVEKSQKLLLKCVESSVII